ncbi:MAG TPA: PspC domain-containing protein [Propionibacteriaceae bacterium]|nr:PspC domain-containing protein [Propionibacteriaceae bacterium]
MSEPHVPAEAPHGADRLPQPTPDADPALPKAVREREGAWVAGVATGIAHHLGWPVMVVRGAFVALAVLQFVGVLIYAVLWVVLPAEKPDPEAPGLESASRRGLRKREGGPTWTRDAGAVTALALFGVGVTWFTQAFGFGISSRVFWPFAFAATGVALVWRQADEAPVKVDPGTQRWLVPFVAPGRWMAITRSIIGLGLVGAAVGLVAASSIGVSQLPTALAMAALMVAGVVIVGAPWLYQLRRSLSDAREEKIVSDARADMAAHLHDSVLQTLALIQRQAEDPKAVASIARRQERELRSWLYDEVTNSTTFRAALATAATEVEDERGVEIEVVCVGDAPLTPDLEAVVRAAREAMMNAAKHSGAPAVDVYAEIEDGVLEVFIRDRGKGFEMEAIGDDRMGVRRSIIERLERHGGSARVRSEPGEGTEVRLEMRT